MLDSDAHFESPFLLKKRLLENDLGFAIYDGFPVSKGHVLVVPHRVYANYFESTTAETEALHQLVIEVKKLLDAEFAPDGYNVGINCGEHAGQTIPHVHIHVIPRYKGDMPNPRGGVRGVIPSKQNY